MTKLTYDDWNLMTPEQDQELKPTIRNDEWVWLPLPEQDKRWLELKAKRVGK